MPKESSILLLLYTLSGVLPYLSAYFFGNLIDKLNQVISGGADISSAIRLLLLYGVVVSVPAVLSTYRVLVDKKWEYGFQTYMEIYVLKKRAAIDIATYEDPKFQDLTQRAFRQGFWPLLRMSDSVISSVFSIASLIVGSIIAASISWKIYLVVILTALPRFYVEFKYGQAVWSIWQKDSQEQRRFSDLRSYFMGRKAIAETKLLQSGDWLLRWASQILHDFNAKHLSNEQSRFRNMSWTHLLSTAGLIFAIFLIILDLKNGKYQLGSMFFIVSVVERIRSAVSDVLSSVARQNELHLTVQDLTKFFETKPMVASRKDAKRLNLEDAPTIIFENVGFKYPNSDEWRLRNVNVTLWPGQKIGLVGNNGAGKTTLVRLLCRIYDPTEGRILINGIDLRDLDLDEWISYVGYMSQEYIGYDFKVRNAIGIGRTTHSDDDARIRDAAKTALADTFIGELKKGYDQPLGVEFDDGVELSAGQKQRMAIAKIVFRNAFLTIFDEPTASVDAESEEKIFNSIRELSTSMIAILISHDFSTIAECDVIIVLDHGRVKEVGPHQELMRNSGQYKKLYDLQAQRFIKQSKARSKV